MTRPGQLHYTSQHWRGTVRACPTWVLEEELAARGLLAVRDAAVRLPGLVVDPLANTVTWRHDTYLVTGRQMQVLYLLALNRREGRRGMHGQGLAERVWRGWETPGALLNLRVVVSDLRKRLPDLITRTGRMPGLYGLALEDEPASQEVAS